MLREQFERLKALFATRGQAYRGLFKGPLSDVVLADLAKFCRAYDSTFHPNARLEGRLDGRREVWLRITEHLRLTDEEMFERVMAQQQATQAQIQDIGDDDGR